MFIQIYALKLAEEMNNFLVTSISIIIIKKYSSNHVHHPLHNNIQTLQFIKSARNQTCQTYQNGGKIGDEPTRGQIRDEPTRRQIRDESYRRISGRLQRPDDNDRMSDQR